VNYLIKLNELELSMNNDQSKTIYKMLNLSAAHHLDLPYESKCNRIHGHNFKVEIWINGEINDFGMVMDFYLLKKEIMKLDHRDLNDLIEMPTAENIGVYIIDKLSELPAKRIYEIKVRVWETPTAFAEIKQVMS